MKYTGDQVLETMSKFAQNRNNEIYSIILSTFELDKKVEDKKSILEFGAGRGEFIDRLRTNKNVVTYASEIDPKYLKSLKKRHLAFDDITIYHNKFDGVFAIDVLEHVEHDLALMKQIYSAIKKNGKIFIYVPARPELYSDFDKNIGHYRRYVLSELKSKAEKAGFVVEDIYYHDFLGYLAAIFNKFTTKGDLNQKMVGLYDSVFFPITMFIEGLFHPPIGKSLVLKARKI